MPFLFCVMGGEGVLCVGGGYLRHACMRVDHAVYVSRTRELGWAIYDKMKARPMALVLVWSNCVRLSVRAASATHEHAAMSNTALTVPRDVAKPVNDAASAVTGKGTSDTRRDSRPGSDRAEIVQAPGLDTGPQNRRDSRPLSLASSPFTMNSLFDPPSRGSVSAAGGARQSVTSVSAMLVSEEIDEALVSKYEERAGVLAEHRQRHSMELVRAAVQQRQSARSDGGRGVGAGQMQLVAEAEDEQEDGKEGEQHELEDLQLQQRLEVAFDKCCCGGIHPHTHSLTHSLTLTYTYSHSSGEFSPSPTNALGSNTWRLL